MKTVQAELPEKLYNQIKALIAEGWFANEKDVITEALRRFLETYSPELMA
jgi:Arc/MetJ-type ribon-helix-helix transcriptional regulator